MDFNRSIGNVFRAIQLLLLMLTESAISQFRPSALTIEPPPMVYDAIPAKCYNFTVGNYNQMEFYSPNYPNEYPNKTDCVMYIQAPPGFVIELYFMDRFSVELSEGCRFDFIEFRDGPFGYSKFISRFCGDEFPVSIQTESRFLWAQFSSDDLVQYDGFRAVYEYKIDESYTPEKEKRAVCRSYLDNMGFDGELNSKVFPLADTSQKDYPISDPVDCTWEMLAERGYRILLSNMKLHMFRGQQCGRNRIEIYDGTTNEDDRTGVYCGGSVPNYRSESNRMYLRIFGSRLSEKPVLLARYTVYKPANTTSKDPCSPREFYCDGMCLNQALVCNGHVNCPDTRADEKECSVAASSTDSQEPLPLLIIILAGVGGVVITVVIIVILVTCRKGSKNKRKPNIQKQDSQKRNALEMAVSDSTNTAYHAKQNIQGTYYSLPRPAGHATMMQHRGSFSSKVPSEGDFGEHIPDPGSFKKYLQLDQNITDDDSSRCPSPYSPGFTTIIEQHPLPPGMTPDLGWNYPSHPMEQTPTSPTLAENLSRLQRYNQFATTTMKDQTSPLPDPLNSGMTMEFKYDPTTPVYPATKFRIKSPDVRYGWNMEGNRGGSVGNVGSGSGKSLTIKNQDAEVAPDLTREIETT